MPALWRHMRSLQLEHRNPAQFEAPAEMNEPKNFGDPPTLGNFAQLVRLRTAKPPTSVHKQHPK